MLTLIHSVSRLTPPCGQSLIAIIQCCQGVYRQYNQMKILDVWHSQIIHSISSKLTTSIAYTLRCLHVNFGNNQISLSVKTKYF